MAKIIDNVLWALVYAVPLVLLGLEWRYRRRSLRLGTAFLALAMLAWFQPNHHAAWRRAMSTPPADRITHLPRWDPDSVGRPLSEYESGVFTMSRAVRENAAGYQRERWLALGILFWLACSPAFRRSTGQAVERRPGPAHAPEPRP